MGEPARPCVQYRCVYHTRRYILLRHFFFFFFDFEVVYLVMDGVDFEVVYLVMDGVET